MSATQQENNDVKPATTSDLVTVSNVAEIFNAAGFAFKKIGELVQQLDQQGTASAEGGVVNGGIVNNTSPASNGLSHWDTGDVEQFQTIITNFNDELSKLSNNLKNKMAARLQAEHTEKALERITPADREAVKTE